MPQHYTVPTKNAFAALDDSDYEDTVLAQPDEQAAAAAASTAGGAAARPSAARQQAEKDKVPRQQQPASRNAQQQPAARRARPATEGGVEEEAVAGTGANSQRVRAERRPRRGSAHAVPTEGRPHKREFDRHSGTGRGFELKRSGHGAANWGVATDNLEETPIEEEAPLEVEEEAGPAITTPVVPPQQLEEPVAAPKAKSYAEYMAEMEEKKRALLPAPKAEAVAEADPDKLEKEGYSVYTKDIVGPQRLTKEEAEAEKEEVNKKKVLHLAEIAEESGVHLFGRGGRGGRGGRDNRQPSGPRKDTPTQTQQQQQAPRREINLADSAAFPTLQAH
eukprot:Protomagalhaensia_wolfi_Nauph_80__1558@NODE_1958_length_1265_cov_43_848287_g1533_i0_p1_GENE_NODE_1958_length_1265_cov_43_848287_g1533_i0NODE_1958_length_1265_cov_43_848287_g1533_i0_p1_ORF_typecomplete_len334_score98_11HABP4_PAIRBP1/PF04774_15/1_8e04HABP4_PAIRBP1/PF04774_15/1_2e14HABP4_PAIRBP1/PF04774_15/1_8e04IHABP4_N/PF16174_5/0_00042IHABP4_N/PF16174_5/1_7e02_NODE_1958_length_1265_cov_43_848287_g1533_i0801081